MARFAAMKMRAVTPAALAALGLAVTACGSSHGTASASSQSEPPVSSVAATGASSAVNDITLATGSDAQQITQTIKAFYRATWENQGAAACSLFSDAGRAGFLQSARVAFPDSVNTTTTCPQVMSFYNADLQDSASTLQQAGVNVSGDILEDVGVAKITVAGSHATAVAPENVEEFIQPKTFELVKQNGRWLIDADKKIGKTLAQLVTAKAKGQGTPSSSTSTSSN